MRFLVDAQLPRRLARWLVQKGHDALHTLDLPSANRTTDEEITSLADLMPVWLSPKMKTSCIHTSSLVVRRDYY